MDIATTSPPDTEFPNPATHVHLSFIGDFSEPFARTSFSLTRLHRQISSQPDVGLTKSWTLWLVKDK